MEKLHEKIIHLKLRTKFLLILSSTLVVVFCITFATTRLPYRAYDEQLYRSNVQTISLFAEKLQSELDEVANLSFRMLSDNVLQKNLTKLRKTQLGTAAWLDAKNEVEMRIGSYAYNADDIISMHVTTEQGLNFFYAFGAGDISKEEKAYMLDAVKGNNGRECWVTFDDEPVRLMLAREIREIDNLTLEPLGVIMIHVDLKRIVERCLQAMENLGCPLSAAIYEGQTCLYASDETVLSLGTGEDGYAPVKIAGEQWLCVRFTSWQGWNFVTTLSYADILSNIRYASQNAMLISLIAAIVALTLSGILMASILKHLHILVQKFDAFAVGTIPEANSSQKYEKRRDEIGQLHRHFDRMARDYDRMMRENYDKQLLLKEAQVQQLRAQIRPHFLYNTLESIYCLAKFSGDERIATMTDALGKLLRTTLSNNRDMITVAEDMRIANEYLRIQLIRYGSRLHVESHIDDMAACARIPSMTIQPLIENAVHHAAEEMSETCEIRVYGQVTEKDVTVIVEDNGPGMDEDILEKLESGEVQPDGLGIGLRNIHRRIQLAFSTAYGLEIRRDAGKTRVIVHLPGKIREDETDV